MPSMAGRALASHGHGDSGVDTPALVLSFCVHPVGHVHPQGPQAAWAHVDDAGE